MDIFVKILATLYPLAPSFQIGSENVSVPAVLCFGFIFNEEITPGALGWTDSYLHSLPRFIPGNSLTSILNILFFPVASSISFSSLVCFLIDQNVHVLVGAWAVQSFEGFAVLLLASLLIN